MKQRSGVTSITWIILGLDAVLFLVLPLIGVIELFLGDPPYPRPWAELFYLLYLWYWSCPVLVDSRWLGSSPIGVCHLEAGRRCISEG